MTDPIRVLLVDDHKLVRAGLQLILEAESDIEVAGEAENGADAIAMAAESRPDVVCMDVQMPVMGGIDATSRIVASHGGAVRVLMLTTFRDDAAVRDALQAGASGFVLKNSPPETLIEAIRVVHQGDALLDPQITRSVIAAAVTARAPHSQDAAAASGSPAAAAASGASGAVAPEPPALAQLTEREREVLLLLAEGLSNAEIAQQMFVSGATIKTHVSNLLAKLGVHDRIHAVIFAYEQGLVGPAAEAPRSPE
ncbi:DNA-binding response regulator [Pseudoclavibacter endophyticus]|uniref:Response regulator transcription factor n=1 Tax=Pseudoclavibacter endophyticus TaxID=1778590 RepID=A0A6H9WNM0_9MICO|nr:response regulator transcription factor [Pseudoclavibacter endophyticus]KAB1648216.1 response regulator transcription factor [Pseudoclavibacter endophyticus]GGA70709.1 DNA-binding response regulator [Pseudoclavibacter endophyticus]